MQGECKKLNKIFLIKTYNSTTEGLVKIIPTKKSLELADHSFRFGRNSLDSELSVKLCCYFTYYMSRFLVLYNFPQSILVTNGKKKNENMFIIKYLFLNRKA